MKDKNFKVWTIILLIVVLIVSFGSDLYIIKTYNLKLTNMEEATKATEQALDEKITIIADSLGIAKAELEKTIEGVKKETESAQKKNKQLEEDIKGLSIQAGDFSAVIPDTIKAVVSIFTNKGQASGFIVTEDGYIVTNYHVIEGISTLGVQPYGKETKQASIVTYDKINDVAILKINETGLDYLSFANSDNIKIGETVAALGNPGGFGFTVTDGIVSQKDRIFKSGSVGLIQTDVAINPGNSGGPLINKEGKVVGVINSKIGGYEGIGFAIPSNHVAEILFDARNDD
ncbi:MAG: trypsin-like peptidase domain-containing protein [Nanoarchaeota archaeon]|nr:trypsin-like peptidase domain-containing protein [Nanoarchaeota archaeon]